MRRDGQKDRSSAFRLFALLLAVFCAALTTGGLIRVYRMAAAYELSMPENAARAVVGLFNKGDYNTLVAMSNLSLSPFEDVQTVATLLEQRRGENPAGFVRLSQERYRIESAGQPLADLTLRRSTGAGAFGFDVWEAEHLMLAVEPRGDLHILAPAQVSLSLNGKAVSADYIEDAAVPVEEYGTLPECVSPAVLTRYRIGDLLAGPQLEAFSPSGTPCPTEGGENSLSVTMAPEEASLSVLSPLAEHAAKAYANFVTRDAELADVLPFFLESTTFYNHLRQYDNRWYNAHDAYSFEDLKTGGWQALDENHASCDVTFLYSITMGRHVFDYPSHYTLCFVRIGREWKISNLLVR